MLSLGLGLRSTSILSLDVELSALQDELAGVSGAGIFDFTQATNDGTYTAPNLLSGGTDLTQATGANQPGIDPVLGATMDGGDLVTMSSVTDTFSIYLAMVRDSTDLVGHIVPTLIVYQDGGATVLPATVTVDGVSVTTRGDLSDQLLDDAEHDVVIQALSLTGLVELGRTAGTGLIGSIRRAVVIPEMAMGLDLASARAAAAAWIAL